jgi:hypothetical protein
MVLSNAPNCISPETNLTERVKGLEMQNWEIEAFRYRVVATCDRCGVDGTNAIKANC